VSRRGRGLCVVVGIALALGSTPPPASADADPASDYLVMQDVFFPYSTEVSKPVATKLEGLVASAKQQRLPIKVALIGATSDLGGVPTAFGRPQVYARFLGTEITFNGRKPRLLVVMPTGFGLFGLPAKTASAVKALPPPGGSSGDALAKQAIVAVQKIATSTGRHLALVKVAPKSGSTGGRSTSSPVLVLLGPVVLLLAAGGGMAVWNRRRERTPKREP
jgi:hypothetical protein